MLSDGERRFLAHQRIAHLATADRRAVPHVVPVCFAISESALYITLDEKPKRHPATALKRMTNIVENPAVAVVVDRYDEDWALLGWVMLRGRADILTGRDGARRRANPAAVSLPAAERDAHRATPGHRCPHRTDHEVGKPVRGERGLTGAMRIRAYHEVRTLALTPGRRA